MERLHPEYGAIFSGLCTVFVRNIQRLGAVFRPALPDLNRNMRRLSSELQRYLCGLCTQYSPDYPENEAEYECFTFQNNNKTISMTVGTLTVSHSLGENNSVAAPAAAPRTQLKITSAEDICA